MRRLRNPLAIALVAVTFRLILIGPVWLGPMNPYPNQPFTKNEPSHIAAHIARGEGFASPYTDLPTPTAQQPPLYPLFLAVIFKLFGIFSRMSLCVIVGANAVTGGVVALLLYRLALKYFSQTAALVAAWMWAVLPPTALTDLALCHYSFSTLAVLSWLLLIPDMSARTRDWMLLGIAVGVALLLNPMLVLLIPASALWLLPRKGFVAIMLAMTALTLAPWYVRNYRMLGSFYPCLRDNLGLELYIGNHAGMSGIYDYFTGESPYRSRQLTEWGEARFMAARQREAMVYIVSAPEDFLLRAAKRLEDFWLHPWPFVYFTLIGLALWGFRQAPRPLAAFTAVLFLLYPVPFYVTQTSWATSYRHPIEPLLLLMAAVPVERIIHRLREQP